MLVRLRPRALARVDDEQEEVDPGRARDHRADEALVARHVDDARAAAVRELERRVAEIDRDPAPLLLGKPVGVLPGQRPHEPRLPVVDVAGGPDRQGHLASIRPSSIGPARGRRPRAAPATGAPSARGRRRARASAGRATSLPSRSFPGGMTVSVIRRRALGGAAARMVRRIAVARSSSQSWRIPEST